VISNDGVFQENNDVWLVGNSDNIIYHINEKKQICAIAQVPCNDGDMWRRHPLCVKTNNKLICLPDRSNKIFIYDLSIKAFEEISLGFEFEKYGLGNAYIEDDFLWCFSYRFGKLYQCDLMKGSVEVFNLGVANNDSDLGEAIKINNYYYVLNKRKCCVTRFDTISHEIEVFELECNDKGFGTITFVDGLFYLTGYENYIYVWEEKSNRVKNIHMKTECFLREHNFEIKSPLFSNSICVDETFLVYLPNNYTYVSDHIIIYNLKNDELSEYKLKDFGNDRKIGDYFAYNGAYGEDILIYDSLNMNWWVINPYQNIVKKGTEEVDMKDNYGKFHFNNHIYYESQIINLESLLNDI